MEHIEEDLRELAREHGTNSILTDRPAPGCERSRTQESILGATSCRQAFSTHHGQGLGKVQLRERTRQNEASGLAPRLMQLTEFKRRSAGNASHCCVEGRYQLTGKFRETCGALQMGRSLHQDQRRNQVAVELFCYAQACHDVPSQETHPNDATAERTRGSGRRRIRKEAGQGLIVGPMFPVEAVPRGRERKGNGRNVMAPATTRTKSPMARRWKSRSAAMRAGATAAPDQSSNPYEKIVS
jgi:hypothetical protein